MLKKLFEYIKQAIRKMVAYKDISTTISGEDTYSLSDEMSEAIELWKNMYKDESPWLSEEDGIYSLGLPQTICNEFSTLILDEVKSYVTEPGIEPDDDEEDEEQTNTRASFLNKLYQNSLMDKLREQLEKGMALGGFIIKPYTTAIGTIAFDFIRQGDFYPISFDDDGNIKDVAFVDQFIEGNKMFTKVERQTYSDNKVVVENKAFITDLDKNKDDDREQDLGTEVELTQVPRWASIEPEVTIDNVDKSLFGYYKVPLSNTVDLDCPLGVSIFQPAIKLIERADKQFSRLDWEYEGGQIAIDVDPTALSFTEGYFGNKLEVDTCHKRVYRAIDLGTDETYEAFAPSLRDANYLSGLSRYLMLVEDKVGLARGTLSEVQAEARTATEIRTLRQKTFTTVQKNQEMLEKALNDAVYAADVFTTLYNLAPLGDYVVNTEWNDSVLSDTDTELEQKMSLQEAGILSKAEIRSWYTGEDIDTAEAKIAEITQESNNSMMNDIFSQTEMPTLESDDSSEDVETGDSQEILDMLTSLMEEL